MIAGTVIPPIAATAGKRRCSIAGERAHADATADAGADADADADAGKFAGNNNSGHSSNRGSYAGGSHSSTDGTAGCRRTRGWGGGSSSAGR